MKLPAELRLLVYQSALEELVATITTINSTTIKSALTETEHDCHDLVSNPHPADVKCWKAGNTTSDFIGGAVSYKGAPILGALAFLHTSSQLRAESVDAMLDPINAHYRVISARIAHVIAIECEAGLRVGEDPQLPENGWVLYNHRWKIKKVKQALDAAARSLRR